MKNAILFQEYMVMFGEIFEKEITKLIKDIYWKVLNPYTDEQCKKAFDYILLNSKFFPKPVDIISAIEPKKMSIEELRKELDRDE